MSDSEQRAPMVMLHISKTGGSALRVRLLATLASSLRVRIDAYDHPLLARGACTPEQGVNITRELLSAGDFDLAMGHFYYVDDLPVRWFTMVREPVRRIVSNYHKIQRWGREREREVVPLFHSQLEIRSDGNLAEFIESAERLGPPQFFFEQSLRLAPDGADVLFERIAAGRILVGFHDEQEACVRRFADSFGWGRIVPDPGSVNRGNYEPPGQELQDRIAALIPDEIEFYAELRARLEARG
jgi:hypothetical protein